MFLLIKKLFIGILTGLVNEWIKSYKVHFNKQSKMYDSTYLY